MNDDRLRQILREGDPASGETGLTQDEVQAMRRTVLTAPESRRRLGWLPLGITGLAGTAVLILLVFGLWSRPPVAPIVPPAEPRMATVITPVPAPPELPEPAVASQSERAVAGPAHRRTVRRPQPPPARHGEPVTLASLPDTPASSVREIRFSTPGGTRIIWELSAGDAR